MSALWKVSKYNYYCEDEEGNYLICNLYKGVDSFCKISKCNVKKFKHILELKKIRANCEDPFLNVLYQKGFLVDDAIDELFRVKSLYFNTVMSDSLSLTIMPTEKCNFRCQYCYETFEKGKMTSDDQRKVLKYIQKQLMHSNHLHISWFGGEPLLALDVIEYIMQNVQKMCGAKKIIFSSNMTTNAYFLDAKTFDKLYQLKVTAYQITVDGLKEQHDKQRIMADGSGTYDKIIQNLMSIKNLSKDKYKFARITIRVNITRDILDRIDEFIQFYKNMFGDDARFNIRFAITDDYGGETVKNFKDELVNGNDIYTQLDTRGVYNDKTINFADALSAFQPMNLVCYAAYKNTYTIGSDLTLYRCTINFDKQENVLGKILENGDINLNRDLNNKWYIKDSLNERCNNCFYLPCCYNMCCPLRGNLGVFNDEECTMMAYKNNLGNYLRFLDKRMKFQSI